MILQVNLKQNKVKMAKILRFGQLHKKLIYLVLMILFVFILFRKKKKPDNLIVCQHDSKFLSSYPFSNVSKIIQEIEIYGSTSNYVINDIFSLFHILISPSKELPDDVILLIMVKSAARNFGRRNAIRSTWGGKKNSQIHVLFSLGYHRYIEREIRKEASLYKDILQGSFIDEYRNNTFKTSMTYKWISDSWRNCKYILLVDDDYLVNIDETLQFVSSLQRNNTSSTMFGPIVECWKPVRTMDDPNSYITKEEYPWELYPPYLSGGSILTTFDVVRNISKAIPFVRKLSIDDLYIGIIANFLGIKLIDDSRFTLKTQEKSKLKQFLCLHGFKESSLLEVWFYLLKDID